MRCPKCTSIKSSVVDSRQAEDGNTIRRRRECESCGHRFTTYERVEEKTLVVVKKDGTREQFSREKIFNGIIRSAQKRPVSSSEIEEVVNRIEQKVRAHSDSEVESDLIGNLVMEELVELDEITYVRFASVYRSFKDVGELENLLKQITKGSKTRR
ncbi:transcriptional regulator NrdR [Streptococcus acidominimus]|uniref:Transcriptional repressor NrdR n=1 Tax=Streptococcus acidominimus TaxID=1326 RepID=A0A1Q8EE30_STRAI|nr:transcriptional regulator NrdR [Streptococcus acidominimus]MBF0846856.1 transcriptional repressor NrdR [Streptococcus danieliae]MBF0819516.1 transcriptional repressor NrdR [Streptococcus acidominimus]MBF0839227.1 transcriptional repressor NrdR [Streptococcus acidominimus]OLF50013.1 transcriptional regulator NrdR [Streptococcus acidominimus]TFU29766.1 transcriptional repressor NrdR [Streptococcus acidominimus]